MRATRKGACASLRIFVALLNSSLRGGGVSPPAARTTNARDARERSDDARGVEARKHEPEWAARDERGAARATRRGAGATRARGATAADEDIVANMVSRRVFARGEVSFAVPFHREPRGLTRARSPASRRFDDRSLGLNVRLETEIGNPSPVD
jgi:hypothetical protein